MALGVAIPPGGILGGPAPTLPRNKMWLVLTRCLLPDCSVIGALVKICTHESPVWSRRTINRMAKVSTKDDITENDSHSIRHANTQKQKYTRKKAQNLTCLVCYKTRVRPPELPTKAFIVPICHWRFG